MELEEKFDHCEQLLYIVLFIELISYRYHFRFCAMKTRARSVLGVALKTKCHNRDDSDRSISGANGADATALSASGSGHNGTGRNGSREVSNRESGRNSRLWCE